MGKAIVLCSGGLDSVTCAYYVKNKLRYDSIEILFFNYGQKALKGERKCARKCAKKLHARFTEINARELGRMSSSLINKEGSVKKIKDSDLKNTKEESVKWYVPCRNTVFLSYALALAESIYVRNKKTSDIFVGFESEGGEHYPDTSAKFIEEFNELSKISCSHGFKIHCPFIKKDKNDIILLGKKLGVNFEDTHSCYIGKKKHCGYCLACKLRQAGFHWAGLKDPAHYKHGGR